MAAKATTEDLYRAVIRVIDTSKFTDKDWELVERTSISKTQYLKELRLAFNLPESKETEIIEIAESNATKKKVKPLNGFIHLENYVENTERFHEIQPFFYDDVGAFWFWQDDEKKWQLVDEIDIMNAFDNLLGLKGQTITSGIKRNYLEAFKRTGRLKLPKDAPKELVQFKDKAFNIKTKKTIEATPEYWFCNPIPWELAENSHTPTIDKLFTDWVGKKYVQTLYEIIAYSCYTDYPIQLLFCLYGMGRNGKSCFLKLITKFFGIENTSSTELDLLTGPQSSRFESIKLYKKLVCLLGETNFESLSRSSILKKLTGGDPIGFEMKGKQPFDGYKYAKIIIASNSLPITEDTSEGFYRRWLIIDFPNEFPEGKDILLTIPEKEYQALARKVTEILPGLIERGEFTNQGRIEDRKQKYIEASNPLSLFISEYCEEEPAAYIHYSEFFSKYVGYLKRLRRRVISRREFSKVIAQEGYEIRKTSKKVGDEFVNGLWLEGYRFRDEPKSIDSTGNIVGIIDSKTGVVEEVISDENDDCAPCARCADIYPSHMREKKLIGKVVTTSTSSTKTSENPEISTLVSIKGDSNDFALPLNSVTNEPKNQKNDAKINKKSEKTANDSDISSKGKQGVKKDRKMARSVFELILEFIGDGEKSIADIEKQVFGKSDYAVDAVLRKMKKDGDILMTSPGIYRVLR